MGKVLYRKYRSKSFDEVVGQEHITSTLRAALKAGKIAHAYLFTGPRGVGKTSVARILAREVNNLKYDDSTSHIDIIEIDAASNRRIDEIRELRDRIHTAPTSSKYKVYIIDEVHMLTKEAFNALLKTLEEPPEHAIFILATTEAHKVPETIISRTQRFSFRPIEINVAQRHLQTIAKQEKIKISEEAVMQLVEHSQGSFRDSISLLDQVSSTTKDVGVEDVDRMLGVAPSSIVDALFENYVKADVLAILETIELCKTEGYNGVIIAKQLAAKVRSTLTSKYSTSNEIDGNLVELLKELSLVGASQDAYTAIELAFLATLSTESQPGVSTSTSQTVIEQIAEPVDVITEPTPKRVDATKPKEIVIKPTKTPKVTSLSAESWQKILLAAQKRHNTLYSVLRMAVPTTNKNELTLAFAFPFHQKRIEEARNQEILIEIVRDITDETMNIVCVVDPSLKAKDIEEVTAPLNDKAELQAISNIFGDTEVLE